MTHPLTLARTVALRDDFADGVCPAWMEAAERVCGRPPSVGYLCSRHHKVAEHRHAKN